MEPHFPSKPNVPLNLELGTVFAAFLSLGIAFSSEYLMQPFPDVETGTRLSIGPGISDQKLLENVEDPGVLEALTGLPVLAITKRS